MTRSATRIFAVLAALVIGLVSVVSTVNANADENVFDYRYKQGEITFINNGDEEIIVNYGDGEGLEAEILVFPHDSVTVYADSKHLTFSASIEAGLVGQAEWPGIDLSGESDDSTTDFRVKPGKITWYSHSDNDITIDYADENNNLGSVVLPAHGSVSLETYAKHLTWSASTDQGLVDQMEWPGVDLSKQDEPGKDKPGKEKPKDKPKKRPSLPKTGV